MKRFFLKLKGVFAARKLSHDPNRFWDAESQDNAFVTSLLETRGMDDRVLYGEIGRVLFWMRLKSLFPTVQVVQMWRLIYGRYRESLEKNHGRAPQQSGGGTGSGPPVAGYFTGYGGGFTSATSVTTGGAGYAVGAPVDGGIVAGEITAYRCWRLKEDGKLYSMYMDDFCWEPGQAVKGDLTGERGIHGFKSLMLVGRYGHSYAIGAFPAVVVMGTIEMWGEVIEHERGYRASKARIISFFEGPDYDADALRKLYGLS